MKRYTAGFTLIELLIAVAIVAALASFAYSGYTTYVLRAKRAEGQTALLRNLQRLEQHYLMSGTYGHSRDKPEEPWPGLDAYSSDTPARSAYRLAMARCTGAASGDAGDGERASYRLCVRLRAMPHGFDDGICGELLLQSDGQRGAAGRLPGPAGCW
ncbi:MAG: prepilin-type N-terminal cleavage/methylation domain-containing protein [Burkholderiales bacterium]|nr:prepilin-type N-terminal cleavage/methylation domain-containing protein [Burkholderiales bacterium]MDE2287114.1 prepilin-type N-terminal cleavage/methylation domain-containing protein [Burkholderiales bacterium]MDE2610094.1 prepilin-type N-terminal cleavage/methylation domain-containing protein [Burkholderiales bacterium]